MLLLLSGAAFRSNCKKDWLDFLLVKAVQSLALSGSRDFEQDVRPT